MAIVEDHKYNSYTHGQINIARLTIHCVIRFFYNDKVFIQIPHHIDVLCKRGTNKYGFFTLIV